VWQWDNNDPYGQTPPNQNPTGQGTFTYNQRFPGQYFDSETNLFYNYYRDYDPSTGRYIESDPIGLRGGLNTYGYVLGNPISNIDLKGNISCAGLWGGLICAGVIAYAIYEAKSCTAIKDSTKKALDTGHKYGDETNNAIDCMKDPKCRNAQSHASNANNALQDNAKNTTDAANNLATGVPGTTVTGPVPASSLDAVGGAITSGVTDITGRYDGQQGQGQK
jgi:RHS repeat-associated protein